MNYFSAKSSLLLPLPKVTMNRTIVSVRAFILFPLTAIGVPVQQRHLHAVSSQTEQAVSSEIFSRFSTDDVKSCSHYEHNHLSLSDGASFRDVTEMKSSVRVR